MRNTDYAADIIKAVRALRDEATWCRLLDEAPKLGDCKKVDQAYYAEALRRGHGWAVAAHESDILEPTALDWALFAERANTALNAYEDAGYGGPFAGRRCPEAGSPAVAESNSGRSTYIVLPGGDILQARAERVWIEDTHGRVLAEAVGVLGARPGAAGRWLLLIPGQRPEFLVGVPAPTVTLYHEGATVLAPGQNRAWQEAQRRLPEWPNEWWWDRLKTTDIQWWRAA